MRHVLLGLVLMALVGCSVGPAANRAAQLGTHRPAPGWSQTSQPPGGPRPEHTPSPRPDPAPAEGSATITRELAVPRLNDACCLAELPGGDLLVSGRRSGRVYRVAVDAGIAAEVGVISGVALGEGEEGYALFDLAVPPDDARSEVEVYAYYTQGDGAEIGRYRYDPAAPAWEDPLSWTSWTIADQLPAPTAGAGTLAFGPDGMVYASTGSGDILRMETTGHPPADKPSASSTTYAAGHGDVVGIAWDVAGRAWSVDTAGVVRAVVPGAHAGSVPALAEVDQPHGLAYGAGSLWTGTSPAGGGLWRLPLDGTELVAAPARLPLATTSMTPADVAPTGEGGLWVLTTDGRILRVRIS
jgi:aldose sugar dehydrogenase